MTDRQDAIDAYTRAILPYDGPHSPGQIIDALAVLAGVAQNLANATRRPAVLPTLRDVETAVQHINQLTRRLPLAVAQIGVIIERIAADERLCSDDPTDSTLPRMLVMAASTALGVASMNMAKGGEHIGHAFSHLRTALDGPADPD